MSLHRAIDGAEPSRDTRAERLGGRRHEHRVVRDGRLALGSLACPRCDAPVSPGPRALSPSDAIGCPYCGHGAAVREFLSLGSSRPAIVEVRVVGA